MRTACLINHYCYGDFIGEAVGSVLRQTHAVDEIVIVDDGSPVEHLVKVREVAAADPRVKLIEKENGGQLSCFQVGVSESSADVVFFLDADDAWEPAYVATVVELLERRPDIGSVASNRVKFFSDGRESASRMASRDVGFSVVHALHQQRKARSWRGGASTSCLAIRRTILERIFPVPDPRALRLCADEVLVHGSSLAGARKYFIGEPLVRYRVHASNAHFGREITPEEAYSRRIEMRQLTEHMRRKLLLPSSLIDIADYEFWTIENPTREEYGWYRDLVKGAPISRWLRFRLLRSLFINYYGIRRWVEARRR